ncbi:energy transducer TonB [Algoriphagus sp. NG3]|uniref:energy transducer TonB n=1 Tax=Algoriphagus sp. NG3 TaxID=3097546 RepID=UPI002A7F8B12|nr:energy transducer TonB [Algoriphagus sp. NG3]WPR74533.1 energy transducer TonB [Algoriphagus sp. NG3]
MLSDNLKYPAELRKGEVEGQVVVSLKIDQTGHMTGEHDFLSGNLAFEEEIERVLVILREKWDPSFMDGKSYDSDYMMSFDFKLSKENRFPPNPFISTSQKPEEKSPLDKVNEALEENPYMPSLYENRAEILTMEGKELLAEMDLNQAKFLKDKMLTEIVIVGYLPMGPKAL